jgi:membrane-associated phospholipid phosphatase
VTEEARFWNDYPELEPWINLSLQLVADQGVKDPPRAARAYALVSVAMYDAAVAASHWKHVYKRAAPDVEAVIPTSGEPSYPSAHAAVAAAATRVLAYAFSELPAQRFDDLAEEAARSRVRAGANYPSDVKAGLALGRAVGDEVVAYARTDGYGRGWRGAVPRGYGSWRPPPGSVALPVEPLAGTWRPWVLRSGDQLRPPPPPDYGSRRFLVEAREVMRIGNSLSAGQKREAGIWAAGTGTALPPGMWNRLALGAVRRARLSLPRMARVFALVNVAQADAAIAAWDCKYAYWSPRPINAIRDLGLDSDWTSYLPTPLFPSYVSGHSTFSAAAATVLDYLFPSRRDPYYEMAEEAGMSRVYGGIHYRSDNLYGLRLGRQIGRLTIAYAERDGAGRQEGWGR